jgi:radical SAM superfamily enzyme YgiQ (UPF0313 family)
MCWGYRYTPGIANAAWWSPRVKAQLPNMLVVVGGPEVQRDNAWVLHHSAVDVAVIGEGEQTFCEILQIERNYPQFAIAIYNRLLG